MKMSARFRCTRLHFLYSCKENEAKESTRGLRPSTPAEQSSACTALRQPYICKPRWNPFGEPSQTRCACEASACSPAFQTHGKVRFYPAVCGRVKIPSRATPSDTANAALAFRQLPEIHEDIALRKMRDYFSLQNNLSLIRNAENIVNRGFINFCQCNQDICWHVSTPQLIVAVCLLRTIQQLRNLLLR